MGSEWIQSLLTYRSIKYIQVKDWRLVAVQYSIQLAILIYIIGYTVIYAKGYQSSETAISAIYTKVKGSGIQFGGKSALFDAVDLVLPPVEQNALFITTSYIETINQTRSLNCVGTIEDFTSKDFKSCTDENKNLACTKDTFSANGKRTGNCAKSKSNSSFCELEAWCPIEDDDNGKEIRIPNVKDWTILVRANVLWPGFGYSTSNTQGDVKPVFGKSIFKVVDIVNETGYDFDSIVSSGMEVLVSIRFDCDSDKDEKCLPVFKFTRIDDSSSNSFTSGFNYRRARYLGDFPFDSSRASRNMFKTSGIRFVFELTGTAHKFNFKALSTTIGAGISFMAIAGIAADFCMQNLVKEKDIYLNSKFQDVKNDTDDEKEQLIDEEKHSSDQEKYFLELSK